MKRTDADSTEHERIWALTGQKNVPEDCTQLSDNAAQAAASLQPAKEILVCGGRASRLHGCHSFVRTM